MPKQKEMALNACIEDMALNAYTEDMVLNTKLKTYDDGFEHQTMER